MRNIFFYLYLFVDYCVLELLMEHNKQFRDMSFYFDSELTGIFFFFCWFMFKNPELLFYFILIFILSNQDKLA